MGRIALLPAIFIAFLAVAGGCFIAYVTQGDLPKQWREYRFLSEALAPQQGAPAPDRGADIARAQEELAALQSELRQERDPKPQMRSNKSLWSPAQLSDLAVAQEVGIVGLTQTDQQVILQARGSFTQLLHWVSQWPSDAKVHGLYLRRPESAPRHQPRLHMELTLGGAQP